MRPILFVWRGVPVRSFPVMVYLATLVGACVALYAARLRGLDLDRTAIAIGVILCCLFIGARVLYVALNWRAFGGNWRQAFDRSQGGMAFSGGLLVMLLCSPLVLVWLQLPVALFWDSAGLGMLAGLPLSKAGCFLHGCCCGRPTDAWLGLNLPDHSGVWRRRIPTQLLEIGWSAALFLLLIQFDPAFFRPGVIFCFAVVGYAGPRFIFHSLREQGLTSARELGKRALLSAAIVLVASYLVWLFR